MLSLGWNLINDSGTRFNKPLKVKNHINAVAFPSRLSAGRYFKSGLGLEVIATYNRYKEGHVVDGLINPEDKEYFGLDSRLSYDLNRLLGETGFFDPYIGVGTGYSYANDVGRGTYNAVIGFRTWFNDRWALDFNSSGKWSFGNEASNHVQHAAGVIYQFGVEKGLTKKGAEKLVMNQEIEREQQRLKDSIAAVREAENQALLLAEQMEREKEIADAKALQEAEKFKKDEFLRKLSDLGHVYFEFNSSYLNASSKKVLDQIASLMEEYGEIRFEVGAHADSRGSNHYNNWLSERRAKRAADYLIHQGIDPTRVISRGYGEERLTNHCKDHVPCTAEEHSVNRRSEIELLNW